MSANDPLPLSVTMVTRRWSTPLPGEYEAGAPNSSMLARNYPARAGRLPRPSTSEALQIGQITGNQGEYTKSRTLGKSRCAGNTLCSIWLKREIADTALPE